jgi:hypothetical protein
MGKIITVLTSRNSIEYEVIFPALVNLVEPVLDVIVGQNQVFQLN